MGLAVDPVPGDPLVVREGGQDYLDVAEALASAGRRLRSLEVGSDTVSQAVQALGEQQRQVADHVESAYRRYDATARALLGYAPALERAQAQADAALATARVAHDVAAEAASNRRRYLALSHEATEPQEQVHYRNLADNYGDDEDRAVQQVRTAHDTVQEAVLDRNRAADHAADQINAITENDGLGDSWWDDWGADLVTVITDVAGWVSTVAGVLALAVCWIPVIGQALAALFLTVSAVAAIVNAIGNIVLASTGDRSMTEAVISVAGAALACVGLGGSARIIAGAVTRGVLVSEARNGLTAAGSAATWGPGLVEQAEAGAKAFGVKELLHTKPADVLESTKLWLGHAPDGLEAGDDVFRVYGSGSTIDGASWTTADPRLLGNFRTTMGLPDVNTAERLVVAKVDDAVNLMGARRGLPLDGYPGGAPEYLIPGALKSGGKGLTVTYDGVFTLP